MAERQDGVWIWRPAMIGHVCEWVMIFLWHLQCGILLGWEKLHIHHEGGQFIIAFRGIFPRSVDGAM